MAIELSLIDACKMETRDLNRALRRISASSFRKISVENPRGIHHIAAGLQGNLEISLQASRNVVDPSGIFNGDLSERGG